MSMTLMWLVIFLILITIEATTVNLVSVWFAIGALVSTFVSLAIDDTMIQLIVFVLVSTISLLLTKKFVNKIKDREVSPTNLDRIIGSTGIVTEDINPYDIGEVKVDGKRWSAISKEEIKSGSKVEILAIDGVKLQVKLKKEEEK